MTSSISTDQILRWFLSGLIATLGWTSVGAAQDLNEQQVALHVKIPIIDLAVHNAAVKQLAAATEVAQALLKEPKKFETRAESPNIQRIRRDLGQYIREVRLLAENARQSKTELRPLRDKLDLILKLPTREQLLLSIEADKKRIEKIESDIRKGKVESAGDPNDHGKKSFVLGEEANLLSAKAGLSQEEEKLDKIDVSKTDAAKSIESLNSTMVNTDLFLTKAEAELRNSEYYLNEMDASSARALENAQFRSNFTYSSTLIFALMIALLIAGFFYIATRSPVALDDIFSSDKGIQFITLFSLVITIILFGVLNIIEGKELSILLGGLSGFILGRTTDNSVKSRSNGPERVDNQKLGKAPD
jgi:hypothetical protein